MLSLIRSQIRVDLEGGSMRMKEKKKAKLVYDSYKSKSRSLLGLLNPQSHLMIQMGSRRYQEVRDILHWESTHFKQINTWASWISGFSLGIFQMGRGEEESHPGSSSYTLIYEGNTLPPSSLSISSCALNLCRMYQLPAGLDMGLGFEKVPIYRGNQSPRVRVVGYLHGLMLWGREAEHSSDSANESIQIWSHGNMEDQMDSRREPRYNTFCLFQLAQRELP